MHERTPIPPIPHTIEWSGGARAAWRHDPYVRESQERCDGARQGGMGRNLEGLAAESGEARHATKPGGRRAALAVYSEAERPEHHPFAARRCAHLQVPEPAQENELMTSGFTTKAARKCSK